VISLRQNAERLRATGRVEEAEEFDKQAQIIDDKADKVATSTVIMFVLWLMWLQKLSVIFLTGYNIASVW
jgi:hypothetical protein